MRIRGVVVTGLIFVCPVASLKAQAGSLQQANSQAQGVVDRAVEAYGGPEKLQAMSRQFTWVLEGELIHLNQSPSASRSVGTPFTMVLAGDLDANRFRADRTGSYPGGFYWRNIDVIDSGKTRRANPGNRAVSVSNGGDITNYQQQLERLPQMVVARLDRSRRGIVRVADATIDGKRLSVIEAPVNAGALGRYYFDDQGLLVLAERMIGDDYAGDVIQGTWLSRYRSEAGTMVPGEIVQTIGGSPTLRLEPTLVLLAQKPADSLFTLPPGLSEYRWDSETGFAQVGPGVYMANGMAGGYRLLVADLGDHLAVMESPNGSVQSGRAIELIKKQFPGKPIRYVIPTHHHDDHAGGLRAFIANGAIVITTKGNEQIFRKMATATYGIEPDEQERVKKPIKFKFVDRKRVLEGGGTRLELYDMGPGPHADEMLVAYVPASRFLFQGDLFNTGPNPPDTWGNLTTVHFAEWLSKSGLAVDSIGGTHSAVRTRAELDAAAARVRETAAR